MHPGSYVFVTGARGALQITLWLQLQF